MPEILKVFLFILEIFYCHGASYYDECYLQTTPMFKCANRGPPKTNGDGPGNNCLPMEYTCDCKADCYDGSDEYGCELVMRSRRQCVGVDGCYDVNQHCDCWADCPNGSDERDCPYAQCKTCDGGEKVYNKEHECDCVEDCEDGEDEKNCNDGTLYAKRFICGDGACQKTEARCNGTSECADGSDEAGCGSPIKCYKCSEVVTKYRPTPGDCIAGNTDGLEEKEDCMGYCTTTRSTRFNGKPKFYLADFEEFTTRIERGCTRLHAEDQDSIEDGCYRLKEPKGVDALLPGVSTYPYLGEYTTYDVATCSDDLCNTQSEFGTDFCADAEPNEVGLLVTFDKSKSGATRFAPKAGFLAFMVALFKLI